MGFISWLVNGAGFENDGDYSPEDKQRAQAEKMRIKDEKRRLKEDKKKRTSDAYAQSQQTQQVPPQNSYLSNPDQYNTTKYDSPMNDYGLGTSNVGGYGSKNIEFVNPTKFEDVRIVINYLRNGESIMLNLNQMGEGSQRLLDCISGAVYALNGNLRRVDANIFLITPEGFNIIANNHGNNA